MSYFLVAIAIILMAGVITYMLIDLHMMRQDIDDLKTGRARKGWSTIRDNPVRKIYSSISNKAKNISRNVVSRLLRN